MPTKRMPILSALFLYFLVSKKYKKDIRKQKQLEMLRFILERKHGIDVGCLCTDGLTWYKKIQQNHFVYSCQEGKWIMSKKGIMYCSDVPEIRVSQILKTHSTMLSMTNVLLGNFFKGYPSSISLSSITMARVLHKTSTPSINFSNDIFDMQPSFHGLRTVAAIPPSLHSLYFCAVDTSCGLLFQNYGVNNFVHSLVANYFPLEWKDVVRILYLCFTQNWRLEMQDAGLLGMSCKAPTEEQWYHFSPERVLDFANRGAFFFRTISIYASKMREEIKQQQSDERDDAVSSIINRLIDRAVYSKRFDEQATQKVVPVPADSSIPQYD
jgi:hypothetical protein